MDNYFLTNWMDSVNSTNNINYKNNATKYQQFQENKNKNRKSSSSILSNTSINECCICLEDMIKNDTKIQVLSCGHSFHKSCLSKWFEQDNTCNKVTHTCPYCRSIETSFKCKWISHSKYAINILNTYTVKLLQINIKLTKKKKDYYIHYNDIQRIDLKAKDIFITLTKQKDYKLYHLKSNDSCNIFTIMKTKLNTYLKKVSIV